MSEVSSEITYVVWTPAWWGSNHKSVIGSFHNFFLFLLSSRDPCGLLLFFFHGPLESFAFVYKTVGCFDHSTCVLLFLEQYLLAQGRELFEWGYGPRACKWASC